MAFSKGEQVLPALVPFMIGTGIIGLFLGLGAFLSGLIAFFKDKDKSPVVILSLILGLFALTFILGELLIQH